jgi:integrase
MPEHSSSSARRFQPFNNPGNVQDVTYGKVKPAKPSDDFPLFAHANGQWAKKIRGNLHYFGAWEDPDAALALYLEQKDDLHAGRTPRPTPAGLTLKELCNKFLAVKEDLVDSGELSSRTWMDNKEACDLMVDEFGKHRLVSDLRPEDFTRLRGKMAERWGPVRLGNVIHRMKSVFKYGFACGLMERPVLFGPDFKKPSAGVIRRHRAQSGEKMLEPEEIRKLIDKAETQLKAMILLGVNAGFGNTDVGSLPLSAVDLDRGWVNFPRPKTGIPRRCPLWPETVAALRVAINGRLKPKPSAEELVFVNTRGSAWVVITEKSRSDNVAAQFALLMDATGLTRKGTGFYTLRHVHRTIADEVRDPVACDLIMGHTDPSIAGHYREQISDERLQAVAEYVRQWLFAKEGP